MTLLVVPVMHCVVLAHRAPARMSETPPASSEEI
jgi:hypothetical protein